MWIRELLGQGSGMAWGSLWVLCEAANRRTMRVHPRLALGALCSVGVLCALCSLGEERKQRSVCLQGAYVAYVLMWLMWLRLIGGLGPQWCVRVAYVPYVP